MRRGFSSAPLRIAPWTGRQRSPSLALAGPHPGRPLCDKRFIKKGLALRWLTCLKILIYREVESAICGAYPPWRCVRYCSYGTSEILSINRPEKPPGCLSLSFLGQDNPEGGLAPRGGVHGGGVARSWLCVRIFQRVLEAKMSTFFACPCVIIICSEQMISYPQCL